MSSQQKSAFQKLHCGFEVAQYTGKCHRKSDGKKVTEKKVTEKN